MLLHAKGLLLLAGQSWLVFACGPCLHANAMPHGIPAHLPLTLIPPHEPTLAAALGRTSVRASASTRTGMKPSWTARCITSSSSTWSRVGVGDQMGRSQAALQQAAAGGTAAVAWCELTASTPCSWLCCAQCTAHMPPFPDRTRLHGCEPHLWLPARQDGLLPHAGGQRGRECAA